MIRPGRKQLCLTFVLVLVLLGWSAGDAIAGSPPAGTDSNLPTLAPMLEKVLPGVVSIAVKGHMRVEENPLLADPFFRRFFGLPEQQQPQEQEFQAAGSGVIVDAEHGYIVTNYHVVERAEEITVALSDGRHLQAKRVGVDPATDVAVVQVPGNGLTALPLGDSDQLRVGDYVVAIGNPFGLEQTVTSGIVSALGRSGLGIEGFESFIQTDASINPGNSGGALVNLRGELVGINAAIVGPSGANIGIGFAIPINMARSVMEQLIAHGSVRRGQLGIKIQDLTPELAKNLGIENGRGALIAGVTPGSPAAQAGLQAGDVITTVNGQNVRSAAELRNRLGLLPVGSAVQLGVIHDKAPKQITAVLAAVQPVKLVVPADVAALTGVVLGSIDPDSPLYGRVEGAVVLGVKNGSRADRAGLVAGDVIVGVNQKPVQSPDDVVRLARAVHGRLLLQIMRDDNAILIVIG
jgi:serine protease Do/serine protease DegQ